MNKRFYSFGEYRLDTHNQRLLLDGKTLTLTLKEFELLFALVENAGDVVSKDELLDAVWKDVSVAEETLTRNISWLRKKLGDGSGNVNNEAVGGQTPLTKTLDLTVPPIAGQQITFNLTIRNDGMANVVALPINDRFDPAALQFISAIPEPDRVETGLLVWNNALRAPLVSVLTPQQTVKMTVVFTALTDISQTLNQAEVMGARDSYGNNLAPAADEVPIRILPAPTATPTPRPTRVPQPDEPTETPTALPTLMPTGTPAEATPAPAPAEQPTDAATPTASATAVAGGAIPIGLPNTGTNRAGRLWLFGLAVLLVAMAALVLILKDKKI